MSKLSATDKRLLDKLTNNVDNYAHADEVAVQDAPLGGNDAMRLGKIPGNPSFKAAFDVQILVKYFSVAAGVYTGVTAAALLAAEPTLATQLAAFVFNQSDFEGGFKYAQGQFPLSGWAYDVTPFRYGRDYPTTIYGELDATAKAQLRVGDLVIPYYASPGATDYVALVILRTKNVAYSKLLGSLGSNRFWINNIRYKVLNSAVGISQYGNDIVALRQSMFGKFGGDSANVDMFKMPEQFQDYIIDVPIKQGFDKDSGLGTYINYDSVDQTWSIFVASFEQVKA